MEKPSRSRGQGRLAFLKTKRAIAVLTFLVVLSVVLIGKWDPFLPYFIAPLPTTSHSEIGL